MKLAEIAKMISENLNIDLTLGPMMPATERIMTPNWDFKPEINLYDGLKEVCEWVKKNGNHQ